jgi:hypothetical protein
VGSTPAKQRAYVHRLADAGLALRARELLRADPNGRSG